MEKLLEKIVRALKDQYQEPWENQRGIWLTCSEQHPLLPFPPTLEARSALSSAFARKSLFSLTELPSVFSFKSLRKASVFSGPCRACISFRSGESALAIAMVIASRPAFWSYIRKFTASCNSLYAASTLVCNTTNLQAKLLAMAKMYLQVN